MQIAADSLGLSCVGKLRSVRDSNLLLRNSIYSVKRQLKDKQEIKEHHPRELLYPEHRDEKETGCVYKVYCLST